MSTAVHDLGPPGRRTHRHLDARVVVAGPALLLGIVGVVSAPAIDRMSTLDREVDPLAYVLLGVAAAAVTGRRRWPLGTLAVTATCTAVYLVLGYPYGPVFLPLVVAVHSVARRLPVLPATLGSGAALAAVSVHLLTNEAALPGLLGLVPATAWVAVPYTAGLSRRLVVEARARERGERDRRLIDAERLALASEVHDVVGHGLAAIQMQADIALHLREARPAQAYEALEAISRASADALVELRAALAPTAGDDDRAEGGTPRATPGLARVEDLRDRVTAAGVPVDLTVSGRPRRLPDTVDLVAYRVLQESLTNVVKHAPGTRARVTVDYLPDAVRLEVANADPLAGPPVEGLGIAGMRRRVRHVGGCFSAGPRGDPPAFRVRATLPAPPT